VADQKDTHVHKPDGTIAKGEKIGHANKEARIRRRDGLIFPGEEMGYVDREKNVRRPDGILFKGEVVGKVKGTAAHAKDGVIFEGEQWGYVDDDGNVRQRDGVIFRGRVIGKMRGHNKEGALGFYVLRFKELVDRFEQLEQEAGRAEHKGKYIGRVRHMLSYVPEFDGLGDFDGLIRRLKQLEDDLVGEVERHRRSKVTAKDALIREAERWSNSSEWKTAATELKSLQGRWKEVGSAGNDEEALWQRFRAACDRFFERRTAHFDALDRQRAHNAAQKEQLCSTVESLRHSDDLKAAASRVKDLQGQWKTIGPAPKDVDDRLWNRFRHACDEVFAAAHRQWERRHSEYEARKAERERNHAEWERKQQEWRAKMHDTVRAKREQASRLRESIEHDEGNVSRWRDTIDSLRPGGRADEIQDSLEAKISDVEDRIRSKEAKLREIESDIEDIEARLRG
jgi:chromosome segregation ATPase